MSEQARSPKGSTALIVAFVLIALVGVAGNYMLDMQRRSGRAAATGVNNDLRAAEQSLDDLGVAEASYIAAGQNIEATNTWMNTATALDVQLETALAKLNSTTTSADAKIHYAAASPLVEAVAASDRKARGLVGTGQSLVAADVVIESADLVKQLKAELAAGRDAEMAGFEKKARELGWISIGGNAAVMMIGLLLLIGAARRANAGTTAPADLSISSRETAAAQSAAASAETPTITSATPGMDPWLTSSVDLSGAADLCVDLGLVQSSDQLNDLMSRAATVLEAKGVVLWVSESGGGVLRPTMAHGYSERVLQRMGTLSADGDNVTSLAFRTRQPQVVRGSIDGQGALAVPLISGSGCVGVLAAEVQGAKPGDARFAIARIIAAQLSTLIAPGAPAVSAEVPKTASQM